ncbi:MAG: SURF1 family protein, partial [Acidimicrobiia bacterium]
MKHGLLQPRWLVATLVVVLLSVVFVRLGFWQLDRLEERRSTNLVGDSRFSQEPISFEEALEEFDEEALAYLRVSLEGLFDPANEVLVRSQVHRGSAGFHVITPLILTDGNAVMVNRGWVPLSVDTVPVGPAPPSGEVSIEGWIQLSQERTALGPADSETGRLSTLNRVDLDRIQEQLEYEIAPVYVVMRGESGVLPEVVAP